jgi:tripartite-type tricarboxylate transporter receptor subunit TctC
MNEPRRRILGLAASAAVLPIASNRAAAQTYPSRPITTIDLGQEISPADQLMPEALAAYQKAEIEKWWPNVKAAGIKAE